MAVKPFLDNIETVGMFGAPKSDNLAEVKNQVLRNRKRGNRIAALARKNIDLYEQVNDHLMQMSVESPAYSYFVNFRADVQGCCRENTFREFLDNGAVQYCASKTCKHKVCNICNSERKRVLRRKYLNYLSQEEIPEYIGAKATGNTVKSEDLEFFHLTLTVPHSEAGGFLGELFYAHHLMREFNFLRKKPFWKQHVFAGEFGIEVVKNHQSGLHIHIHALIVAHKTRRSRNVLHKEILRHWNMQTVDPKAQRQEFTEEHFAAIKKGNSMIDQDYLNSLDPKGSTFVGLESLYVLTPQGKKRYVNQKNKSDLMSGILECIKYHFEPMALNKEDGSYDFELLEEILPKIHRKPLYRKFGSFHGVKCLNLTDRSIDEEQIEAIAETAQEEVINPETLQLALREEYQYFSVPMHQVFFIPENNYRPVIKKTARKRYFHEANTLIDAVREMTFRSIYDDYSIINHN